MNGVSYSPGLLRSRNLSDLQNVITARNNLGLGALNTASFDKVIVYPNGLATAPDYSFSLDGDTGIYGTGTNQLGFACGGTTRGLLTATGLAITGKVVTDDGTALLPAFSFSADPDTGLYRPAANQIAFTANGALVSLLTASGIFMQSNGRFYSGDGSVTYPSFTFASDVDSGLYRVGADNLAMAVGGNKVLDYAYSGGAARLGFFGAANAPKPSITGSRGGNAALASLLTELATLGLLTNTTTA